jgi:hypothetical protein
MSPRNPRWLGVAVRLYGAVLHLYPASLRDAHGEEMRQAFRDRCLEVVEGRASFARVVLLELLPDTLRSATRAQWDDGLGSQRGHQRLALSMLVLALLLLAFRDTVSNSLLDWTFKTRYMYYSAQANQVMEAEERQVRGLADQLAREPSAASKAQAAFLYRTLYSSTLFYSAAADNAMEAVEAARATNESQGETVFEREFLGRRMAADAERAAAALAEAGPAKTGWVEAAAFLSCLPLADCNPKLAITRLTSLEPENAYGWSLEFRRAMHAHDSGGARTALARMAASHYYEDHFAQVQREVLGSAFRLLPDDVEARAAVARRVADGTYLGTDDFVDDARLQCSLRHPGAPPATWAESHPEGEADCLRFARLLTTSSNPFDVFRGWALIAQRDQSANTKAALARAQASYFSSATGIGSTRQGQENHWVPWSVEQWDAWARAKYSDI